MSLDGANLDASQEQLGKALDKAHQGEDKELAGQIRDTGERFVRQLFGAMRLTGIHDLENKAYDKPIKELVVTLGQLIDLLGAVHLVSVEGQIYRRPGAHGRADGSGREARRRPPPLRPRRGVLHARLEDIQFRRFIEGRGGPG